MLWTLVFVTVSRGLEYALLEIRRRGTPASFPEPDQRRARPPFRTFSLTLACLRRSKLSARCVISACAKRLQPLLCSWRPALQIPDLRKGLLPARTSPCKRQGALTP